MKSYFALAALLAFPLLVGPAQRKRSWNAYTRSNAANAPRPMSRRGRLGSM